MWHVSSIRINDDLKKGHEKELNKVQTNMEKVRSVLESWYAANIDEEKIVAGCNMVVYCLWMYLEAEPHTTAVGGRRVAMVFISYGAIGAH